MLEHRTFTKLFNQQVVEDRAVLVAISTTHLLADGLQSLIQFGRVFEAQLFDEEVLTDAFHFVLVGTSDFGSIFLVEGRAAGFGSSS